MLLKKKRSLVVTRHAYSLSPGHKILSVGGQQAVHRSRTRVGKAQTENAEDGMEQGIFQSIVRNVFVTQSERRLIRFVFKNGPEQQGSLEQLQT
jgi:hypothetical protein